MAPDAAASERTPLLGEVYSRVADSNDDASKAKGSDPRAPPSTWRGSGLAAFVQKALGVDVEQRILLAGFLITLSFSFTQVP
jgi:hypothetical protein